jgi:signal transduction histidine kinase
LSDAVSRLRDSNGTTSAVAWATRETGEPYVVAAAYADDPPGAPNGADFQAVSTLRRATRLDDTPELLAIGRRHGLSAAAPILSGDGQALAVLLLGPEPARPRTLGKLGSAASRLERPLAAARAADRLARLDREVRQLDRLAALGTLTTEIAHEIRNPLVSMKTFLQLLPERWGDPEFSEEFLALVGEELRRMERLLDVIIEHARPTGADEERPAANVAAVLESTLALFRHRVDKREIQLDSSIPGDLPDVALAGDGLRQVILNLMLNAIEATPSGGTVALRASAIDGFVEISVADGGPGVPPELREAVFEPFYSTRSGRVGGLGLAITRRIVSDAGGTIRAESRERGGGVFLVALPKSERNP